MLNQLQRGDEPALLPCRCSGFLRRPDLARQRIKALKNSSLIESIPLIE
jgi:hypothetical protein